MIGAWCRFGVRFASTSSNVIRVYVDGSCLGNHVKVESSKERRAGYGVWFGTNDPRNESESLSLGPQTNNVAELVAAHRAMEILLEGVRGGKSTEKVWIINTDSLYTIRCCQNWLLAWKKNGWKTAHKKEVKNKTLIKAIDATINEAKEMGVEIQWEKAKGHSGEVGNEAAHQLAWEAANRENKF